MGADRSAAALDARTSKAGTSSSLTDTSEWLYLLNNATDLSDSDVYCDKSYDLEYAQCYTGFCTKNGDGKTASCGCLSMRPSDDNEPKLELGWPSAVLIESSKYRNALEDYVNGDASVGEGLMCTALADGSVWEEYGFDSTPDRVSMYSSDNPYFNTSGEVEECDSDFDFAQCMGAPCWVRHARRAYPRLPTIILEHPTTSPPPPAHLQTHPPTLTRPPLTLTRRPSSCPGHVV